MLLPRITLTIATSALVVRAAVAVFPVPSVVRDVGAIIQNSVAVTHQNVAVASQFEHCERDVTRTGTKTYAVTMISGSPYSRLTAIDDKPLAEADRRQQQDNEDAARVARAGEAPDERARRLQKYERKFRRIRLLLEQLPAAFDFTSEGTQLSEGFDAYVIRATPKRDYRPASREAEVLNGMEVRLWIEQHSFQWIKAEATVVRPVSLEGFLAEIERGTRFSLEQQPVAPNVWLPTKFSMRTRAKILFLLRHRTDVDETYFDYRRINSEGSRSDANRDSVADCLPIGFN
ncbi:MAG TPA: hypothetical protein VFP91_05200 [Vicinamibacterales bacterium]|nr:hypothetical protein [Vicinamibacterales bacterium]